MQYPNLLNAARNEDWHISVVVPARNEESLLPQCLMSLIDAKQNLPLAVSCEIVVAIDSSTDGSLKVCQDLLEGHGRAIMINDGSVGMARAAATGAVLSSFMGHLERCWIASTDADCVVPNDWLMRQLHHADSGIQAVAGIIDVKDFSDHPSHVEERFRSTYLLGYDGTHQHIHGANLGIRADAYMKAGGWPPFTTAEDHGLWRRLQLTHARTCADSSLIVTTSGRSIGRAPRGFAASLAAYDAV